MSGARASPLPAGGDHSGRGGARARSPPPAVVLPTGTGKTFCFASLIAKRGGIRARTRTSRRAAAPGGREDPGRGPDARARASGSSPRQRDDVAAPVVVGSVQTLARSNRLARLPRRFDTVVVDEAHHAAARSYRRILAHLEPSPLILGVTATPQRSDGKPLGEVWEEIVYQRGIAEMIRAGYLPTCAASASALSTSTSTQVAQSGGDFQADALGDALEQASAPRHVLAAYRAHASGRKALVFVPTVALAHRDGRRVPRRGDPGRGARRRRPRSSSARRSSGACKRARRECVANVAVLTEGVDVPSVDCIVMATPTRSQVKYAQCGRPRRCVRSPARRTAW